MLFGIEYEEVEQAFGGNLDPSKTRDESLRKEESARIWRGFFVLLEKYHRGVIEFAQMPIVEGRRYYVEARIHDPSNPLSGAIGHSIVIDEFGKVFDPNPEYGEFESLKKRRAAVSLPHELRCAKEIFEYSV